MKAVVCTKYGAPEVLQIREVATPTPKDDEIRIRIRATTVSVADVRIRSFNVPAQAWIPARLFLGVRAPRKPIFGSELAGDVEAVGSLVTRFKVGDAIFAPTLDEGFGGYAEYRCLPETSALAIKPANISYEEAAAVPIGGITALRFLKKGNIQNGHNVLIYGASGSVGTFAVQIAKHFGAQVTGVCSTANVELVRSLGADYVIDYTRTDFAASGQRFDLIFDAVGKTTKAQRQQALAPSGSFVTVVGNTEITQENLDALKEMIEAGAIRVVIDRSYPLEQIVEAHRYVDMGHKKGNVVITV
jgi:NADPH:quinone reductase-like Zn-dependent oxidoreductase